MNVSTFTIESVHGVKQTFVLDPVAKPGQSESAKAESQATDTATKEASSPTRQ